MSIFAKEPKLNPDAGGSDFFDDLEKMAGEVQAGCWRCNAADPNAVLVPDPMNANPHDSLFVCVPCAAERLAVLGRYESEGRGLSIIVPIGD